MLNRVKKNGANLKLFVFILVESYCKNEFAQNKDDMSVEDDVRALLNDKSTIDTIFNKETVNDDDNKRVIDIYSFCNSI